MTIMSYYFKIKTDKRKGKRIMKNDNSIVKFTAFVLLITMVVLCLVSGTFAKYVDHFEGADKAVVAKWDVTAGNADGNFKIFEVSAIYDTNGTIAKGQGVDDADVRTVENGTESVDNPAIIAPGTWGMFSYVLSNSSDVDATYTVDYTAVEAGVPLLWSKDGQTWEDDIDNLDVIEHPVEIEVDGEDQTIDIFWKWDFEVAEANGSTTTRDDADTALGQAENLATPAVNVVIDFTQVD